jgi:hypothetical protein
MTLAAQKSSLAKVQSILAAGNAKIQALDSGLKTDVRQERIAAIRQGVLAEIGATRTEMQKLQASATEGLPHWSQDAARRRAKFAEDPTADAQQRLATMETLKRVSTPALLNHLEDAIRSKNVAHAECVRLEFESREVAPERRAEFHRSFRAVVDPQAQAMESELSQIAGLASHAETLIHEFARGQSNPIERISTARAAGLAA